MATRAPSRPRKPALTANQLAKDFADKLSINNAKGKQKEKQAQSSNPEATKLASMRLVNTASQTLSNVAQLGWKNFTGGASSKTTLNAVVSSAADAAKHLGILRRISPGDIDVERAAMSVLGKLILLEMFDLASAALEEIHPCICLAINGSGEHKTTAPSKLYLLSVPKAASPPSNPILLNLLSTYLLHALALVASSSSSSSKSIQELSTALDSPSTFSLLSWLPDCSLLPPKHLDSLLTRAYTFLTKLCSSSATATKPPLKSRSGVSVVSDPPPEAVFSLRMHSLRCLAHTSTGVVEGNVFWDQATKFTSLLVKATSSTSSSTEERITSLVLRSFDELVRIAETRSDKGNFMATDESGKNFIAFCDSWSTFAKRAGDISLLQRINMLMPKSSSSLLSLETASSPQKQVQTGRSAEPAKQSLIVEGTKLCNTLAQLSLLLEGVKIGVESGSSDNQLLSLLQDCIFSFESPSHMNIFLRPISSKPKSSSTGEEELDRICTKVDRAVEKVRRLAIKTIETYTSSSISLPAIFAKVNDLLHSFLRACVACLQLMVSDPTLDAPSIRDILHRSIDTLFVLARVTLKVADPRTFIPAFELLSKTTIILDSSSVLTGEHFDIANYLRCISGAFYNLAGVLYQATRYGNAVPFLLESCKLGEKALILPRPSPESMTDTRRKEWTQLEEQLYRRWELLGVCYSKNGDRRKAIDAFKRAIITFPFSSSRLSEQTETLTIDILFGPECNTSVKQLVALVDRVTYIGACELFLPPEGVSIQSCMLDANDSHNDSICLENDIAGALLERQLVSLEPSIWKEGVRVVFIGLLKAVLKIYSAQGEDGSLLMPIRKARTLLRCLEFGYRDSAVDWTSTLGCGTVEEVATEIERLCTLQSFGRDSSLVHPSLQYRAAAHLWVALHVHRRADPEQNTIMTQRSEEACRLMKMLLVSENLGGPKISKVPTNPTTVRKSAEGGRIVSPKTTRMTRLKVPAAPKKPGPVRKMKTKVVGDSHTVRLKTKSVALPTEPNAVYLHQRQTLEGKETAPKKIQFDDFDQFLKLLQLVARILGLLSLILAKAHILDIARKLAQRHLGFRSDGYILASLDLAHEYVTLGKIRRAVSIFSPALDIVRNQQSSQEISVRFLLRFAESLAVFEDVPKSVEVYLEAQGLSQQLDSEEKGVTTRERILARVKNLETAATAANVFATIRFAQGDVCASLESSLQSLRLWNRAIDAITRLRPSIPAAPDVNPFEMTSLQDALPSTGQSTPTQLGNQSERSPGAVRRPAGCELGWGLSEGLLSALFFLSEVYFLRGSARQAEYFARQAAELAEQLNVPAMASRALARLGEVQLHMAHYEDANSTLTRAADLLQDMPGLDAADIRRLKVEYQMKTSEEDEPMELFEETVTMLEELDNAFQQFDCVAFGPRRSIGSSPGRKMHVDVLAPELLSSILSRQLWFLRNDIGDRFDSILEKFLSLSISNSTKAEENALMANLTLHSVYGRFRTDMFLSSLTESTIAVPIGMRSKDQSRSAVSSVDIFDALVKVEKHLSAHLHMSSSTGSIIKIRETVLSLILIYAFRTSLGDRREDLPSVIGGLLDASASLTLRHDMLDAIDHKFPIQNLDDVQWPSPQPDEPLPPPALSTKKMGMHSPLTESDDDDDADADPFDKDSFLKDYWHAVRQQYITLLDPSSSPSEMTTLPSNWTVVNISVTLDRSTLFCCRRECGVDSSRPLIFCIPLKGRRDQAGDGEEDHLTFGGALSELQDIIHSSNESTKAAIHIKCDDEDARSNWWKQRGLLDDRMRELLENIEYCWLGAFKTILNPRFKIPGEMITELREQFEKVFHQNLRMKKSTKPKHRKGASQTYVPGQFRLDEAFVKCFSTLSPKCRDEELEDIVYFVLDLYQYHGVPVAVSEVDIDQVVVDLRTVLEEYAGKRLKQKSPMKVTPRSDDHLFLILDKNVQGIPWESLPILRGRGVSRIPGVQFLHDRILFAQRKREAAGRVHNPADGAVVDRRNGYFILNPSGDLSRTEERFRDWANGMRAAGWDGITGQPVTEQQFIDALRSKDLVIYFGHGGGEQYVRSHRIRNLPTCAATMLWGCSSGALRDLGDFDRTGTPYNYMLAGCPTLVANLWDVTDKDIDKLCQAVLNKMSLNGPDVSSQSVKSTKPPTSLVLAVAQSRDSCKLKYLTGAAPVVYGIPFYL